MTTRNARCTGTNNETFQKFDYGSAVREIWDGSHPSWSYFKSLPLSENSALLEAIEESERIKGISEVAYDLSDLFLLGYPALGVFIPVSLFSYVRPYKQVLWAFATDVLNVVPLLTKGFELIDYQGDESYGYASWLFSTIKEGTRSTPDKDFAAETWVSFCKLNRRIKKRGIIMVCVGFVFIGLGLALEICSSIMLKKKRKESKDNSDSIGLLEFWFQCLREKDI